MILSCFCLGKKPVIYPQVNSVDGVGAHMRALKVFVFIAALLFVYSF